MRDRTSDRLVQEPRIKRIVRPRIGAPPSEDRAVPTPRGPERDERPEDRAS